MRYRGQHEIMGSILEACDKEGGELQTKIMYQAYVSHAQLKNYLHKMEEKGLIVKIHDKLLLTANGRRAYELFKELDGIMTV